MREAIYTVSKDGEEIDRLPSLIWVRIEEPGLCLVCGEGEGVIYTTSGGPYPPRKRDREITSKNNGRKERMQYAEIIIGAVCTIVGVLLSYAAFARNSKKDSEASGKESGTVLTEIGYIKGGVDRIERKQDEQDARYITMAERVTAVESSAKQAHKRIDRLEGHGNDRFSEAHNE